ncbi:hypothetical protein BMAPRL20_1199 [Burkholderia mallei PRL-20]|nr:hypothetical protein BMAPRL20_1199 [Burkholderia mallei PRL-20]
MRRGARLADSASISLRTECLDILNNSERHAHPGGFTLAPNV